VVGLVMLTSSALFKMIKASALDGIESSFIWFFDVNLSLSTVFQGNFLFRPTSGSEISRDVSFGASAVAKGFATFSDTDGALLPGYIIFKFYYNARY
jgi:hypothetical protein